MRFSHLVLAAAFALGTWPALAEETTPAQEVEAVETTTEDASPAALADEAAASADEAPVAPESEASEPSAPEAAAVEETELGPVGVDEHGHAGRIHVVQDRDTLWDISDAYLGTPWVWPSVWEDNDDIANPHLIYPGDHVWISPYEMRKITAAEADALMAGMHEIPAAMEDPDLMPSFRTRPVFRYTERQTAGFVSLDEIEGASSLVDSTETERIWLTDNTPVIVGLGTSEVAVGDQFDIFRTAEKVVDPETGRQVGYLTEELGWLEVREVHDESATAMIELSRGEIKRGDRILPRRIRPTDIEVMDGPDVAGQVMHTPNLRIEMAQRDVLYLNRGSSHGVQIGSPLEIYRSMGSGFDEAQREMKALPDHVIAKMIVIDVHDETSVAVVTHTTRELERGDAFRGTDSVKP